MRIWTRKEELIMDGSRCLIRLPDDSKQLSLWVKLSITAARSLYELDLLSTAYIFELPKL